MHKKPFRSKKNPLFHSFSFKGEQNKIIPSWTLLRQAVLMMSEFGTQTKVNKRVLYAPLSPWTQTLRYFLYYILLLFILTHTTLCVWAFQLQANSVSGHKNRDFFYLQKKYFLKTLLSLSLYFLSPVFWFVSWFQVTATIWKQNHHKCTMTLCGIRYIVYCHLVFQCTCFSV